MRICARRREFLAILGGAAALPLIVRAQQSAFPTIGYLNAGTLEASAHLLAATRKGLGETGYVEGRNLAIEFRWANNQPDRLPELAADLVRRRVSVIIAGGGAITAVAANAATTNIPIVFAVGGDPVQLGLVGSLNRPGGNLTGFTGMSAELTGKQLQHLHEMTPRGRRFAVLVNPTSPSADSIAADVKAAARALGLEIEPAAAASSEEIDEAFAVLGQKRVEALLVSSDSLFVNRRVQIALLGVKHNIPAISSFREDAQAGVLMSYGPSIPEANRQAGIYAGRILKGDKPSELPVMQPTKFELVINQQTAKILGIDVPVRLLAIADDVIE